MTITVDATFENGTFSLVGPVDLPEGTPVRLTVTPALTDAVESAPPETEAEEIPTLYERMKPFIGIIDDLPSDYAEQHDHYLYGTPKRT